MATRRVVGVLVASAPLAVIVGSFVSSWPPRFPRAGFTIAVCSLLIAAMNAYLSFVRPTLFPRSKGYRNVSGAPLVGNVLALTSLVAAFGSPLVTTLAAIAYAVDTGGVPWFLIATWHDESLWKH